MPNEEKLTSSLMPPNEVPVVVESQNVNANSAVDMERRMTDKSIDAPKFYGLKVKDNGMDRTPKNLLTHSRPGCSIYNAGPNLEDLPSLASKVGSTTGSMEPRAMSGQLGGNLRAGPAQKTSRMGVEGGSSTLQKILSKSGSPKPSEMALRGTLDLDHGLSDVAVELGAMQRDPIVNWAEEQRRFSVLSKREKAKADETVVKVTLADTRMEIICDLLPRCKIVEKDTDLDETAMKNKLYDEFLVFRAGNENYIPKSSQTINDAPKTKGTQTYWIQTATQSTQASVSEIYDTHEHLAAQQEQIVKEAADKANPFRTVNVNYEPGGSDEEGASSEENEESEEGSDTTIDITSVVNSGMMTAFKVRGNEKCLKTEAFRQHLYMMERALNMNTYQDLIAEFKHFGFEKPAPAETPTEGDQLAAPEKITLSPLWVWSCEELIQGRPVTCMTWNKTNSNLLVVGYGRIGEDGIVCGWNVKNLEYPERIFRRHASICSIDFSLLIPCFLSIGLADGTLSVYNVRDYRNTPVLDSFCSPNHHGHVAPVWQTGWIPKEDSTSSIGLPERLVSISTDGRVAEWRIQKGFEAKDLMRLKRVQPRHGFNAAASISNKKKESCLSRTAGGLAFSFSKLDPQLYLVGTEEGLIHLCNCNYNEQYVETFWGHTGPVFKVLWSPFVQDCFLSCSGDWSIRLWRRGEFSPIINFYTGTKSYTKLNWSPHCAYIFAAINENAVEIWDITKTFLEPIFHKRSESGTKITSVNFSPISDDAIILGDSNGKVTVYMIKNMEPTPPNHKKVMQEILNTMSKSNKNAASQKIKKGDDENSEGEGQTTEGVPHPGGGGDS